MPSWCPGKRGKADRIHNSPRKSAYRLGAKEKYKGRIGTSSSVYRTGEWHTEFQSQEPSQLRPGVKEFRRVFTRLAVSERVNAHSSFRDEWLIRVEQFRSNFIRGVVKTVSYSHVSSQVWPDLRLRLAVEVSGIQRPGSRKGLGLLSGRLEYTLHRGSVVGHLF